MAEIEHFCDPQAKDHPKFEAVADYVLNMYSAPDQEDASIKGPKKIAIGEAVKTGMVCNETVAYFLVRTDMFLKQCGISPDGIRFR